jgi:hypothetical protein
MDTESRLQQLSREIDEIDALLEEWQITRDPDTLWAIYILEYCLERSKRELRNLLH